MSHVSSRRIQQQRIGMRANLRRKMRRMLLEPLETREMMTASDWKIDFGTATSPLANGWTRATENTIYNSTQQFGWKTSAQTLSGDLGASYSDDRRDYVKSANGTFLLDVPRGTYDVTVGILPPVTYVNTALYVEGIPVETVNGTAGQYLEKIYRVNVADEQVDFRLSGTNAFITKLEVHPADNSVARPLRTIFDPTGVNTPYVFDAANYPTVSDFTLRKSGTNLQVLGNNGTVLATQSLTAITGGVEVLGRNNSAENFTLDYDTGGFFSPPVNFQGGNGVGDQVFLKMTQVTTAASVPLIIDTLGSSTVYGPSAANGGTKFVYFGGMESLKVYDGNLLTNTAIGDLYVRGTDADEYLLYYQETGTQIKVNDVPVGGSYYPTNRIISYGRGGNDRMEMNFTLGAGLKAEFRGEAGNDTLSGGLGADLLIGGGGADRLSGGEANDVLWGDDESTATTLAQAAVERATGVVIAGTIAGNDWFDAGGGDDRLFGGGGDDYMMDGLGDDYANGGNGNDTLSSSGGNNLFRGEAGDDGLYGSYGNEIMVGGSGADRIYPRGGRDVAIGGGGADPTLYDDDQDEDIFVFDVSIWDFDNGIGSGLGSNDTALQSILQTWTSNATKSARIATLQTPGPNSLVVGTAIFADCAMDMYIGAPAASNWDIGEAADWRMNDYNDTLTPTDSTGCCTGFAPSVDPINNATIPELQGFTYQISAYDPDTPATSLTYSLLSGAPSGMSVNSTGVISWTPTEAQGPGSFPVTVQVTDGAHPTTKSFTLTVSEVNQPPTLNPISNKTVEAGALLAFQVVAADSDQPAQTIAYSFVGAGPSGATLNSSNGNFSWTPTLAQSGSYSVTIRATDSGSPAAYSERTFTITVPYRPVIVPINDTTIPENSLFTLQVQASDGDSPSLAYSFVGAPPSGATLNSATGAFSWTPSEGQGPGAFPITIQVSDGVHTTTEPFTLTVSEVNAAPTLQIPSAATVEVLHLLTFTAIGSDTDIPVNSLSYSISAGAQTGMSLNASTGVFTWTPTAAQAGLWNVTIRVTDNGTPAQWTESTVAISATVPAPPSIQPISNQTIPEQQLFSLTVVASDPDTPANQLMFSLDPSAPVGISLNPTTHVLSWTPTEAQGPGVYPVIVRVSDGANVTTATFQVTVGEVNVAPQLSVGQSFNVDAGQTLSFTATASDSDAPTNGLSFSLINGLSGMSVNAATGGVTWSPTEAQVGDHVVTIRVADDGAPSLWDEKQVAIHVNPPINLVEGSRFVTEHVWNLQAPSQDSELVVWLNELSFDTTKLNAVRDSLEFALVDSTGNSIVPTIRQGRNSFFSLSEGLAPQLGFTAGFNPSTGRLSVQLNASVTNEPLRLIARLVNVDGDTNSQAKLLPSVAIIPQASTAGPFPMAAAYHASHQAVDVSALTDVTPFMAVSYAETNFSDVGDRLTSTMTVTNNGTTSIRGTLLVGLRGINPGVVLPLEHDFTKSGVNYYNLSRLLPADDEWFEPGESVTFDLGAINASRLLFDYQLTVLGRLNVAPEINTSAPSSVTAANPYRYTVHAIDADQDTVRYRLLSAPPTMSIDPEFGSILWETTAAEIGAHVVVVEADDQHGGRTTQVFPVHVQPPANNRPPRFTTAANVDANIGTAYQYASSALDEDGDQLTYSVIQGPAGLTINASTGVVTWPMPAMQANGEPYRVILKATDPLLAEATQSYDLYVHPAIGNHAPVFTSDPQRHFRIAVPQGSALNAGPSNVMFWADAGEEANANVSVTLNSTGIKADVFLLIDDTGSFEVVAQHIVNEWADIVATLRTALGGVDLAFGVGRYEDYFGTGQLSSFYDRPFILNQPVVSGTAPGLSNAVVDQAITNALARTAPGNGGDGPESLIEALYQLATGVGYDGNADGSSLTNLFDTSDPQVPIRRGQIESQLAPYYAIGDVPPLSEFEADTVYDQNNQVIDFALGGQGTIGGAGFRDGAIPIIVATSDYAAKYREDFETGVFGEFVTTPNNQAISLGGQVSGLPWNIEDSAGLRQTINALNSIGAKVIGLKSGGLGQNMNYRSVPGSLIAGLPESRGQVSIATGSPAVFTRPNHGLFNGDRIVLETDGALPQGIVPWKRYVVANVTPDTFEIEPLLGGSPIAAFGSQSGTHTIRRDQRTWSEANPVLEYLAYATGTVNASSAPIAHGADNILIGLGDPLYFDIDPEYGETTPLQEIVANAVQQAVISAITQTTRSVDVVSSTSEINFQNLSGVKYGKAPGSTHGFDVKVTGDGEAHTFDIKFVAPGTGVLLGSIPAAINRPYRYDADAVDVDGDTLTYELVGAGSGFMLDATTGNLTWTGAALGEHTLAVKVSDGRGGVAVQEWVVEVTDVNNGNTGPELQETGPITLPVTNTLSLQVNATDADGDQLTYEVVDDPISGSALPAGVDINRFTGALSWTPNPFQVGDHHVKVRVRDGHGGIAEIIVPITVTTRSPSNQFPQFTSTPGAAVLLGETFTYIARASDADFDPIRFELLNGPEGALLDAGGGVLSWQPSFQEVGTHEFTIRATDGRGGVARQRFNVVVTDPNDAPRFLPLQLPRSTENQPGWVTLRALDPNPGDVITYSLVGDWPASFSLEPATGHLSWTGLDTALYPLTVRVTDSQGAFDELAFVIHVEPDVAPNWAPSITTDSRQRVQFGKDFYLQAVGVDPENDPLVYSLAAAPTGMTINPASGLVRWTPGQEDVTELSGTVTFTVGVLDNHNNYGQKQFELSVLSTLENSAPTITSEPRPSVGRGRTYRYSPEATDADHDFLIWSLVSGPKGMVVDPTSGSLSWEATSEVPLGSVNVSLQVADVYGGLDTQSFQIQVVGGNRPAFFTNSPSLPIYAGEDWSWDADGDDPDGDGFHFELVSDPPAPGLSIDPASGLVTWDNPAVGAYVITARVKDDYGLGNEISVGVVVAASPSNLAPVFTTRPPYVAAVNASLTYAARATDPEGKDVDYDIVKPQDFYGVVNLDEETGDLVLTPSVYDEDTLFNFILYAIDEDQVDSWQQIGIYVRGGNAAPYVYAPDSTTITAGANWFDFVEAGDADGDPLVFELDEASRNRGLTINRNGRVAWSPGVGDVSATAYPVTVSVKDLMGASAQSTFQLTVRADDQAPTVDILGANSVLPGQKLQLQVDANDDVAVATRTLRLIQSTVDGTLNPSVPFTLDAQGRALFSADVPGTYTLQAFASDTAGNPSTFATKSIVVIDPASGNPPEVELTTPEADSVLSSSMEVIGTVADDTPSTVEWWLTLAKADGSATQVIGHGVGAVAAAPLGAVDPTKLENGSWVLELKAVDGAANERTVQRTLEVEGNYKPGAFSLAFTDAELTLAGLPIQVIRTYNTLDANTRGDFGFGWNLGLSKTAVAIKYPANAPLPFNGITPFVDGTRVVLTLPDGTKEGFTFAAKPGNTLFGGIVFDYRPNFIADPGVKSQLIVDPVVLTKDGATGVYTVDEQFYSPLSEGTGMFTLRLRNGTDLVIDGATGELNSAVDPVGNRLTFGPDGIEHSSGRSVSFERDQLNRIVSIAYPVQILPNGSVLEWPEETKRIRYDYDPVTGDLIKVTDRIGAATEFRYTDEPHYLTEVQDALGRKAASTEYDADGRVTKVIDAAQHEITYEYDTNIRYQKSIRHVGAEQLISEQWFDTFGNVIKEIDAGGTTTTRLYDSKNQLLTETTVVGAVDDPETNGERNDLHRYFGYDAAGNITLQSDDRGNETRTTYNTFGQPTTIIDPLGNVTRNTYDAYGLLRSVTDANGTTKTLGYDPKGNLQSVTNTDGQQLVLNKYNAYGEVEWTEARSGTNPSDPGKKTYFIYDRNGDRRETWHVERTGANSYVRISDQTEYDAARRVIGSRRTSTPSNIDGVPLVGSSETVLSQTATEYLATGQVKRSTDANGLTMTYRYDIRGQQVQTLTEAVDTSAGVAVTVTLFSETIFDEAGRAIYVTDQHRSGEASGGTRSFYDASDRVYRTERLKNLKINVNAHLGSGGLPIPETYASSLDLAYTPAVISYSTTEYDGIGRVVRSTQFADSTDTAGTKSETYYNRFGEVVETRSQSLDTSTGMPNLVWLVTRTVYDKLGRVTFVTDQYVDTNEHDLNASPLVRGTATVYDSLGRTQKTQRWEGVQVAHEVPGLNTKGVKGGTWLSTTETHYDSQGRMEYTISATGGRTDFVYDALGRRVAEVGPAITMIWNGVQQAVRHRTETVYDPATGRVTAQRSNIAQWTDGSGTHIDVSQVREVQTEYDEFGRQVRVTQAGDWNAGTGVFDLVSAMTYGYDALGRKISEIDPLLNEKIFEYDGAGRLSGVKLPAVPDPNNSNALTTPHYQYGYNAEGQQTTLIDAEERKTRWTFDDHGNQLARTLPLGLTSLAYLALANNNADIRGAAGVPGAFTEGFWYDDQHRQVRHVSFEGVVTVNIYDDSSGASGRLLTQKFYDNVAVWNGGAGAATVTVDFEYDAFGRQIKITRFDATVAATEVWQTEFDAEGRTTRIAAPNGVVSYEYDDLGRKTRTYASDLATPNDAITDTRYTYDVLGRLDHVSVVERNNLPLAQPETTDYDYGVSGELDLQRQANGVTSDFVYDGLGRLDLLTDYGPDVMTPDVYTDNPIRARYDYTVRADGKRTEESYTQGGQSGTFAWEYDDVGRLIEETLDGNGTSLDYTENYTFDLVGNRLSKSMNGANGFKSTLYSYDDNDRLLSETGDSETITYAWGDGNSATYQTGKSTEIGGFIVKEVTYGYNLDGRMATASTDSYSDGFVVRHEAVSYRYGIDGIRLSATNSVAEIGGTTTRRVDYLVDPQNHTGYQQVLRETTLDGSSEVQQVIDYTIGHDLVSQTTTPYANGAGGVSVTLTLGYDGHGSTRVLYDLAGTIATVGTAQLFLYDAYGNALGFDMAAAATAYLYSGEHWDQRVEMQYLRDRWLSVLTGRLVQLDPFFGKSESPLWFNKYTYANSSPIDFIDPNGMEASLVGQFAVQSSSAQVRSIDVGKASSVPAVHLAAQKLAFQQSLRPIVSSASTTSGISVLADLMTLAGSILAGLVALKHADWLFEEIRKEQSRIDSQNGGDVGGPPISGETDGDDSKSWASYERVDATTLLAKGVVAYAAKDLIGRARTNFRGKAPWRDKLPPGVFSNGHLLGSALGGKGGNIATSSDRIGDPKENLVALYRHVNNGYSPGQSRHFEQWAESRRYFGVYIWLVPEFGNDYFPSRIHVLSAWDGGVYTGGDIINA